MSLYQVGELLLMGQVSGVSSEQLRETYTRLRPFIMLLKDASLKKKHFAGTQYFMLIIELVWYINKLYQLVRQLDIRSCTWNYI